MKKPQVKQSLNMSKDVVTDPSLIVINGPKYFKVMVSNANVKKKTIPFTKFLGFIYHPPAGLCISNESLLGMVVGFTMVYNVYTTLSFMDS